MTPEDEEFDKIIKAALSELKLAAEIISDKHELCLLCMLTAFHEQVQLAVDLGRLGHNDEEDDDVREEGTCH